LLKATLKPLNPVVEENIREKEALNGRFGGLRGWRL